MEAGIDIRDYGARGDGIADDTEAFAAALAAAAARGGVVVRVPAGTWRTGPIALSDGIELRVEDGAVVSFIPDFGLYDPVRTRWEGVECWAFRPLLFASGAERIALSGGGILDGNGAAWWDAYRAIRASGRTRPETAQELRIARLNPDFLSQSSGGGGRETQFLRPPLLQFIDCRDVRIEGVTLRNSSFWNTHLVYCRKAEIRGVRFLNPYDAPNTDGLNLDSSSDVTVEDCEIDVGDDCLGLKSGSGEDGRRVGIPTERIAIRRCVMRAGHGGVVVGSETAGGVRAVVVSDCRFLGTDRGLRIKTRRGRGGTVEGISLRDCEMEDVLCPVVVNCYYGPGGPPADSPIFSLEARPADETTPRVRGVRVERLRATGCRAAAGFVVGLPEAPVEDLVILDSELFIASEGLAPADEAAMSRGLPLAVGRGFRLRNAKGVRIEGLSVGPAEIRALEIEANVSCRSERRPVRISADGAVVLRKTE